jgi:hypothetical protein
MSLTNGGLISPYTKLEKPIIPNTQVTTARIGMNEEGDSKEISIYNFEKSFDKFPG